MIEPIHSEEAFLAEVEETPCAPDRLDAWWLGQSGFLVQSGSRRVLFDPYLSDSLTQKYANTEKPHVRMSRRVVSPERLHGINVITSTHGHTDHLDAETLNPLMSSNPEAWLVYPAGIEPLVRQRVTAPLAHFAAMNDGASIEANGIAFTALAVPHPVYETDERGQHKYLSLIASIGKFTVFHSGDCLRDSAFDRKWPGGNIDLAFLPINGQVGNMDGAEAAGLAHLIGAGVVVPCHYHMFEFNTAEPEAKFIPECRRLNQPYRVLTLGERLTIIK